MGKETHYRKLPPTNHSEGKKTDLELNYTVKGREARISEWVNRG